jgi:hypothetical protein
MERPGIAPGLLYSTEAYGFCLLADCQWRMAYKEHPLRGWS